ncbi:GNAT family N-acetyltransferase [Fictibacillus aquaticus]|uniref:N-acetyltransferase domain-containing protein n=1 Tax=Fictibacillus aquaticus TaxID=2021314 RepID=A0A235FFI3_9BACL|nr:GNAT family N-acetyltransferase [Fictibacillus aquaticus]OYD59763.1 hypothetical protein CGZ90_07745 [Fictibacillus aquaticus]
MIRNYKPGDEEGIQALFQEVFNKKRPLEEWRWKFQQNPYKEPLIALWDENEIAGHVSLVPFAAKWFDEEVTFGARLDTMVSQKHRGKRIYPQLNEYLFSQAEEKGFDFLFGFPAELAKKLLVRDSGAAEIAEIPRLMLINRVSGMVGAKFPFLKPLLPFVRIAESFKKHREKSTPFEIKEIKQCGPEFDALWESVKNDYPILLKRSSSFLNWRYFARPGFAYRMFGCYQDGNLKGYTVINVQEKAYGKGSLKNGFIVDMMAVQDRDVWSALISRAKSELSSCDMVNTWALTHTMLYDELKKASFIHKDAPMTLVGKSISKLPKQQEGYTINNWFITPGDVDSF